MPVSACGDIGVSPCCVSPSVKMVWNNKSNIYEESIERVMENIKAEIKMSDLEKVDIRVGTIELVEDVPKSDKLVKLTVNFGTFKRTILVGLKKERENPGEVEGKQALFVVNLAPREMFGIESHGMLWDIGYEDGIVPVLAMPEKPVPNGTRVG